MEGGEIQFHDHDSDSDEEGSRTRRLKYDRRKRPDYFGVLISVVGVSQLEGFHCI